MHRRHSKTKHITAWFSYCDRAGYK